MNSITDEISAELMNVSTLLMYDPIF